MVAGLKFPGVPDAGGVAKLLAQVPEFRKEAIRTSALLAAVETAMMNVQAGEDPWTTDEIFNHAELCVEFITKEVDE